MGRFLAGVAAALLLVTGGFFIWRAQADRGSAVPALTAAAAAPMGLADLAGPPEASERTREEKRFSRYDKDRNGGLNPTEFALTLVVRKSAPKCACKPTTRAPSVAQRPEPPEEVAEE